MKLLVCFKVLTVPERVLQSDWDRFSLSADLGYAGMDFNCFDESALEMGLKIKQQAAVQGTEVLCTALTVSDSLPQDFAERLYSAGYDRVLQIPRKNREFCPELLAEILREEGEAYDLILMGREAGMAETGMVPYLTAEALGWPVLGHVEQAGWEQGAVFTCRDDRGLWRIRGSLPMVCIADNSPEVLRAATLRQRMKVRGKQPERKDAQTADLPVPEPCFKRPDTGRSCTMLDPESPETFRRIRKLLGESSGNGTESAGNLPVSEQLLQKLVYFPVSGDWDSEAVSCLQETEKPLVILPDTHEGRLLAARLSAETGRSCCFGGELKKLWETGAILEKRAFGSNLVWVRELQLPGVITVRNPEQYGISPRLPEGEKPACILEKTLLEPWRAGALSQAKIVFVCGNGMGSKAGCDRVRVLAQKFGAAVGLTRPAALNAWGSPGEILGQSGLQIHPDCCLTLGAAGAGAFLLGVQGAKTLIAVNTDPNALIFKSADYGILMDAEKFMEKLGKEE